MALSARVGNAQARRKSAPVALSASWAFLSLVVFLSAHLCVGQSSTDHVRRALDLVSRGQLEAAEREARLALQAPESEALGWATLGTIRLEQHRYQEGGEYLKKALRLNPRLVGARVSLGSAYLLQGQKAEARQAFHEALKADPGNFNARLDLAQLESAEGNYQASLDAAQPVVAELRRSPEGILLLATDYAALARKDSLRSLVEDWIHLPPSTAASSGTDFAAVLSRSGLYVYAAQVLERAKDSGAPVEVTLALAQNYALAGDLARAEENYQQALKLQPGCTACLLGLAALSEKQRNPEKALSYLVEAKRLEPENPEVLFEFGKVCLERDLVDDAVPTIEKASALHPENDTYAYVLGTAYVGKGTYKQAVSVFRRLVAKHPSDAAVNYALGCALYLDQNFDEAERYLENSLELQPGQKAALYYLGLVADKKNDTPRALRLLGEAASRYPGFIQAHEALGTLLVKEHQYAKAKAELDKALALDPNSLQAHYQLGILLGRTGKQEESQREIALARKLEAEQRARKSAQIHLLLPE